jgi:integrase/recombinase XerD
MTGCTEAKGAGVDFGLLNGVGPNEARTRVGKTGYDTRFADWLMVHRGANRRDARAKAYTLGKILRVYGTRLSTPQEAERVAALIMGENMEASTKRHKLFAVEHYMAYQGLTVKFRKPRADKRCPSYLTQEQLSTLIHAVNDYREYALIAMFIFTGARLGEVAALKIGDVDFNGNIISVKNTKTSRDRLIPMSPGLAAVLREYLYRRGLSKLTDQDPLFISRNGGRQLSDKRIQSIISDVAKRAGLLHVHVHMLRHSFASAWIANGGDVFHLQRVLGHNDIATTMIYLHTDRATLRRIYESAMPRL